MKPFIRIITVITIAIAIISIPLVVAAQVPQTLSYQGVITTDGGQPVDDGDYSIHFRLYAGPESGEPLWSETQTVDVTNGLFNVLLGSAVPLDLPFDQPYFLGVTIGEADELAPRTALTATPYSFMARTVADGVVTEYKLAPGAVTEPALADSAVTGNKIHPGINITTTGTIHAASFTGDGSGLTGLPTGGFSLPFTTEVSASGFALSISNTVGSGVYGMATATSGTTYGLIGQSSSTGGLGVLGMATAESGKTYGVYGSSSSTQGLGVIGLAGAASGNTSGVYGRASSTLGRGVSGVANASSGNTYGVYGESSSTSGQGVYGWATASSGNTVGVLGDASSTSGKGVRGFADATSGNTVGVEGISLSPDGRGVYGTASAGSGTNSGVYGESRSTSGHGVYGITTAGSGINSGVYGQSGSSQGRGVLGMATAASGTTYGVYGQSGSTQGRGVLGWATAASGITFGVIGESSSTQGRGVLGTATAGSGTNYGVYGYTNSPQGYAAYFAGVAGSRNYFQRTVGIGTDSPEAMLHLRDDSDEISIKLKAGGSWNAQIQQTNNSNFNFFNGGNVRMTIRAGGQVGIGTEEPGSFRLAVNGDAAKPGGGSWSVFSDERLKNDIRPLNHGTLDRLLSIHGYTFEYQDEAIENRLALPGRQTGLIAQEVLEVFPDWVGTDDEGYLYITERGLTAMLIEALRELRQEKDDHIDQLTREKRDMEARLQNIEAALGIASPVMRAQNLEQELNN
jgi:hypothetical protein